MGSGSWFWMGRGRLSRENLRAQILSPLGWVLYDGASSAFATVVMAGFFPIFFKEFWSLGVNPTLATARLGTTISVTAVILGILNPFLGLLSDQKGQRKGYWFFFLSLGILATLGLSVLPMGAWLSACVVYAFALIGFNSSNVFYDSFLLQVSEDSGRSSHGLSLLGYSCGYLGGGTLLLLSSSLILHPEFWGFSSSSAVIPFIFLLVGIWWALFSIPLLKWVQDGGEGRGRGGSPPAHWATFYLTLKRIYFQERRVFYFLLAYWFYIDGVFTVITMAVDYGLTIGLGSGDLIKALLLLQFIGFPAALVMGFLAKKWGARRVVLFCLLVYSVIIFLGSGMRRAESFFLLAGALGLVQGGVQGLSRSLFVELVPKDSLGEYFGVFNLVGRMASILGPCLVGWVSFWTQDAHWGFRSLVLLFIVGWFLLFLEGSREGDFPFDN